MISVVINLPGEWGNDKNIKWKYKIEGASWSSPIVWEDKVFISSSFSESVASGPVQSPMPDMDEQEDR